MLPEEEMLYKDGKLCTFHYKPIKLYHPVAGFSYGITGEWVDDQGQKVGSLLLPDVSCDYIFVSRLAVKGTAAQLKPDQLLELLDRIFI